ncbi:hypothetical protein ACEU2D_13955 [Brevibacillus laterosporus]|uniref:hypothetical protein n=1 Tax=Brevibacillus laterosporus TaxID=1465 RepID=UPI0035A59638
MLAIESGYLELLSDPVIEFDDYQRDFLESTDRLQISLKGRQLGFSFVSASRALARSQNLDDSTCIISSYVLDEFAFFGSWDSTVTVYTLAVPVLTRVKHGSLTIISTSLGKVGKFY